MVTRSQKIFENSFFKNGKLEIWSKALIISILNHKFVRYRNIISTKIVITNFRQKLRKSLLQIFAKNYENCHLYSSAKFRSWKMSGTSLKTSRFLIIKAASFDICNPDSVGVNSRNRFTKSHLFTHCGLVCNWVFSDQYSPQSNPNRETQRGS